VLPVQLAHDGSPAQTAVEQHELFVPQSLAVQGQQLPVVGSITVPFGQRSPPLIETMGGVHSGGPASGWGSGFAQPPGHATGSAHPTRPLQFVSVVLEHVSGPGSTLPVHGPNVPNSESCTQVWLPSLHVPTPRVAAGPV
jgi:hypothetical protein